MTGKIEKKEKTKQKKRIEKTEQQRNTLEKLGFKQMMFDFFTAPVL